MGFNYVKNHLFANPSTIEGIARISDLGTTLQQYNYSSTPEDADVKALANDWWAVGDDIRDSIIKYEKQLSTSSKK